MIRTISSLRLKEVLEYDKNNGVFHWKVSTAKIIKVGDIAGHIKDDGYVRIGIDRTVFLAHRLAFLYENGIMPSFIDHINGIRDDNRISNLRPADKTQNNLNSKIRSDNNTGHKGVRKTKNNRWSARITVNKNRIFLGLFSSPEEAGAAYWEAARKYFGEFARLS